jgi:hypothetical protein
MARRALRRMASAPGGDAGGADGQFFDDLIAVATTVVGGIRLAIHLFEAEADLTRRQNLWDAAVAMGLGVAVRIEAVGVFSGASNGDDAIRGGSRTGKLLANLAIVHVLSRA